MGTDAVNLPAAAPAAPSAATVARPPARAPVAALVSAAALALLAFGDWYAGLTFNASIVYAAVLIALWPTRSPRLVWAMAAVAVVLTIAVGFMEETDARAFLHRGCAVGSILAMSAALHAFFTTWNRVEATEESLRRRNEALEASNRELAAREEEIARQNEEMQSQSEELERQSEELRAANEELIRRERT